MNNIDYESKYVKNKTLILRLDQKTSNMLDLISNDFKNKSSCIRSLIEKDYRSKNKLNDKHKNVKQVSEFPFPNDFPL